MSLAVSGSSGGAWGRTAIVTGLQQGNQVVRVEPRGTRRIDGADVLDIRVEKTWPLGSAGRTLGVYADAFNVANTGVPLAMTVGRGVRRDFRPACAVGIAPHRAARHPDQVLT
jgi:hypothetical protein